MTQNDIINVLKSTEIPLFYDHAPRNTPLPFMAVHITQPDNFSADNKVYVENFHFRVDLYTVGKNETLEQKVKDALNGADIFWTKNELYIDDDKSLEVEFEFDELCSEVVVNDELQS